MHYNLICEIQCHSIFPDGEKKVYLMIGQSETATLIGTE